MLSVLVAVMFFAVGGGTTVHVVGVGGGAGVGAGKGVIGAVNAVNASNKDISRRRMVSTNAQILQMYKAVTCACSCWFTEKRRLKRD